MISSDPVTGTSEAVKTSELLSWINNLLLNALILITTLKPWFNSMTWCPSQIKKCLHQYLIPKKEKRTSQENADRCTEGFLISSAQWTPARKHCNADFLVSLHGSYYSYRGWVRLQTFQDGVFQCDQKKTRIAIKKEPKVKAGLVCSQERSFAMEMVSKLLWCLS